MFHTLQECIPICFIGVFAFWQKIYERLSIFLKCRPLPTEGGRLKSLWDLDLDVECFTEGHAPVWQIAVCGICIWTVGSMLLLVLRIYNPLCMFGPEARFTYEHIRKFGYLYNGLKPEYWFWEVAWKRFPGLFLIRF